MELKDIVILVVAVIAWIYSSYRNFQKESAKKIKKVSEVQPEPSFPATTVKQRIPTPKPEPLRREIKEIKPLGSSYKRVPTGSLEWMTNDISVDGSLNKVSSLNVDTFGVDKINSPEDRKSVV